jgi:hypothetical protein
MTVAAINGISTGAIVFKVVSLQDPEEMKVSLNTAWISHSRPGALGAPQIAC